jgi:hypothetical protein
MYVLPAGSYGLIEYNYCSTERMFIALMFYVEGIVEGDIRYRLYNMGNVSSRKMLHVYRTNPCRFRKIIQETEERFLKGELDVGDTTHSALDDYYADVDALDESQGEKGYCCEWLGCIETSCNHSSQDPCSYSTELS